MSLPCSDMLGQPVYPGDKLAYPLTVGRSACMAIYEVVAVDWNGRQDSVWDRDKKQWVRQEVATVTAKLLRASYAERRSKNSSLMHVPARGLKLTQEVSL